MQLIAGEVLKELKRDEVALDSLFNTKQKNDSSQSTNFYVRNKSKIKRGAGMSAACNGVPMTCNSANDLTVTADYPLGVNEVFADCIMEKVGQGTIDDEFANTASDWAVGEATYGYSKMLGEDLTAEIDAATNIVNIYDELELGINKLIDNGYNKKDMIVVVNEKVENEMIKMDLECCDLSVRLSEAKTTASKAFGVMAVYAAPQDVLSGWFELEEDDTPATPLTPQTTIRFRIYIKEYALLKDWCTKDLRVETISTEELSEATRIYGRELIGFAQYDTPNSEVHSFESV